MPEKNPLLDKMEELTEKLPEIKDKVAEIESVVLTDLPAVKDDLKAAKEALDAQKDELAALPAKVRGDFEDWIKLMPDAQKQLESEPDEWRDIAEMTQDELQKSTPEELPPPRPKGHAFRKSFLTPAERIKAIDAAQSVPGGATSMGYLYRDALGGDPFVSANAHQMQLSAPNFLPLKADQIEFTEEATVNHQSMDTTQGRLVAGAAVPVKTYVVRVTIPRAQEADVMGTMTFLEMYILAAYGAARGSLSTAALKAGRLAGNEVKTGAASTALTAANIEAKLLQMVTEGNLPNYAPYMPSFVLHPSDYQTLYQAITAKGGFALDPRTGLERWGRYELHINTHAEANATTNNVPDFFGAYGHVLIQAMRGRMMIDRYEQTVPGAIVVYACFRFVPIVINNDGLSHIRVAA